MNSRPHCAYWDYGLQERSASIMGDGINASHTIALLAISFIDLFLSGCKALLAGQNCITDILS